MFRRFLPLSVLLSLWVVVAAPAQTTTVSAADAAPFIGTWKIQMTNPSGSEQTVKVWEQEGRVAASLAIDRFPPNVMTGVFRDGNMLVLTTTLRENGAPIWAVIALTVDSGTLSMAQMLEKSQTIKRGTGRRQTE